MTAAASDADAQRLSEVRDGLAGIGAARPSLMSPLAAAAHIRALAGLAGLLAQTIEAQVMEACHRIWTVCDEAEAARLVRDETPLTVRLSRRYADCWAAARSNRAVMDLATTRPLAALRLVSDVADAMDAGAVDDAVGREVARIAALPRRRRTEALRDLVLERDAARAGRDPADAARIGELEDQVAALEAERAERDASPIARWADLHRRLGAVVDEVEDLAREAARAPRSKRHDERVLRASDSLWAAAEALARAVRPAEGAA